jgi:hypothetical protein
VTYPQQPDSVTATNADLAQSCVGYGPFGQLQACPLLARDAARSLQVASVGRPRGRVAQRIEGEQHRRLFVGDPAGVAMAGTESPLQSAEVTPALLVGDDDLAVDEGVRR